jgi:hypothetical protein
VRKEQEDAVIQTVDEIEARLHQLRVPETVITQHLDALRKTRRIKRKRLVLVTEEEITCVIEW